MKLIQKEVEQFTESPIVDIEISKSIVCPDGKWQYKNSDVILVGTFYKNKVTQFILKENKELFTKEVIKHLEELSKGGALYCLNEVMEKEGLFALTNKVFQFKDVRKNFVPGSSKERLYSFLRKEKNVPLIVDPFNGDGSLCFPNYDKYKETGDEAFLLEIARHNENCLLKEGIILKHREFLAKVF